MVVAEGKGIRQKVVSTVAVVTIVLLLLLGAKIGKLSPSANKWGGSCMHAGRTQAQNNGNHTTG